MRNEEGRHDTLSIHVTLLPFIGTTGELKTKPTQHSVRELRSIGIQPDVIVCRSDKAVTDDLRAKISLFCDVPEQAVVPLLTMPTIYEVPGALEDAGLGDYIVDRLGLPARGRDLKEWQLWVERLKNPQTMIDIALVGKYVELPDAYLSVKEALIHAAVELNAGVNIRWIQSEDIEREGGEALLAGADGIVVPGGFGERGIEGKIHAAGYARERLVPYLGLCLGMQVMVVDFARELFEAPAANSTEFAPDTPYPVISLLSEQLGIEDKGGTMRLGEYPCRLVEGTHARQAYGTDQTIERHRHRYEFNNQYREQMHAAGLVASGTSPAGDLVEICELRDHPWMVGSQFHPEFLTRPSHPHPLFLGFMQAAYARAQERQGLAGAAQVAATGS
jgi:CTP synthase